MSKDTQMQDYLPEVMNYLKKQTWNKSFKLDWQKFRVEPLAQGEYNLNYLLHSSENSFVFRVNMGSQIERHDQILYEYKALRLLQQSGVTPLAFFVDDSCSLIDRGILIMEYLQGSQLDYKSDLKEAAATFAAVHMTEVNAAHNHLIVEKQPLTLIYNECLRLLETYFCSDLAHLDVARYLHKIVAKMAEMKDKEIYYQRQPYLCIVNTEVNSANFIVNREKHTTHLIDWEMPRWGDPSTDLCHFLSPLTTLWKSDYRFTKEASHHFIGQYKNSIHFKELCDSLEERMALKFPFVYLRGISWSAMAWVAYQTEYQGIRNRDTWKKLQQYMNLDFITSLFRPYLNN